MRKLILRIFLCFTLIGCSSDDDSLTLDGSSFELISFIIESDIDLNGDGIFSKDLVEEDGDCLVERLNFNEGRTIYPLELILSPSVSFDNNNPFQTSTCSIIDFFVLPKYEQDGNKIFIFFGDEFDPLIDLSGELLGNTLTFTYSNNTFEGFGFDANILREDGTIENYQGNAIAVYRLVE